MGVSVEKMTIIDERAVCEETIRNHCEEDVVKMCNEFLDLVKAFCEIRQPL
jgi:hypothetical protein